MKFSNLYKYVFLNEQNEEITPPTEVDNVPADTSATEPEIPEPENFNVEPAPLPASTTGGEAGTLKNFIVKFDEFIDQLNGVDGDSLQKLVADLDVPGSMFEGISKETSSAIIRAAEQVASLSEVLKGFIINSAKKTAQKLRV